MRLIRLGAILICAAALAACTTIGGGSHAVNITPGSAGAAEAPQPVCKAGEQLVILGGTPRCV